jgi:hypothetical protein
MPLGDRAHPIELPAPGLHPPLRTEAAVVAAREHVTGVHIVVEQPAVVHDPGYDADVEAGRRVQHELAGPRLERVEDDHRPVDQLAVALEAADHVEREAVGRAGRDAHGPREALVAQVAQRAPHLGRLEPAPVGIVEQQQVEAVGAAALEAALCGHAEVCAVPAGAAQSGIGEARVALRPLPLALVEVVPHGADQRVVRARHPCKGTADQRVRVARSVGVGGHDRADAAAGPQQRLQAGFGNRLAEAHEAPPAPATDRDVPEHACTLGV